ncbi:MAG TPA: hypothetical protein DCZ94_04265 [Lentisphaeria bacterium]|nr:MAG: hypothetical protein A2X48_05485 [Lentisphaerae bacterium GWF2_49_21]HBC86151.1 hypothetical protein [Lentisphaeria bacterium]
MLMEKHRKNFAIFAIGLFAIGSQTLLFREFLGAFESNDIAVAIFFGAWFLWIAIASSFVLLFKESSAKLAMRTPLLMLAYVPAFILQYYLILHIRKFSGVESYELFPLVKMTAWSLIVNAPVSFVTGALFPLACRWLKESSDVPVAKTFIFESLGSFIGGAGTTVLLYFSCPSMLVSSIICCLIIAAFSLFCSRKTQIALAGILILALVFRIDGHFSSLLRLEKWNKLMPGEKYLGTFSTPQAEYLYGSYKDAFTVVREGGVCESMPDSESAWKIISIHLSQRPIASKILVVGSGLNICRELLRIPQIKEVAWAHYDNEYSARVNSYAPEKLRIKDKRFQPVPGDIRNFLHQKIAYYDIAIINLPEASSSVLNRYFTTQFYEFLRDSLVTGGVAGIRISSGENVIGPELAFIGASVKTTLGGVFKNEVLVPGDSAWFIVSDEDVISNSPDILERNFSRNRAAARIFPPQALRSLYLPDRESWALSKYEEVGPGSVAMINDDSKPLGFLFSLFLSSRQSGADITSICMKVLRLGILFVLVPLLVFVFLTLISAFSERSNGAGDAGPWRIVFCAGFVSIGTIIILMYLFQTSLGSLYLNAGLLSALFMFGLAAGGIIAAHPTVEKKASAGILLLSSLMAHVLLLFLISYQSPDFWNFAWFVVAFLLSGICCGTYFPIAARIFRESGRGEIEAGGGIETSDHVGACAGALVCGIFLVPLYGTEGALMFFMMLLALNIPLSCTRIFLGSTGHESSASALILRHGAYILFGAGACFALWGKIIFNMNIAFYIMIAAAALFVFLAFRKGRTSRFIMLAAALAVAISSAVEFYSAVKRRETESSKPRPLQILEQASKPAAEKKTKDEVSSETENIPTGVPRDVNMDKLNSKIKSGRLSSKEAEFYDKLDGQ